MPRMLAKQRAKIDGVCSSTAIDCRGCERSASFRLLSWRRKRRLLRPLRGLCVGLSSSSVPESAASAGGGTRERRLREDETGGSGAGGAVSSGSGSEVGAAEEPARRRRRAPAVSSPIKEGRYYCRFQRCRRGAPSWHALSETKQTSTRNRTYPIAHRDPYRAQPWRR